MKPAALLVTMMALAGALLALTYGLTAPAIEANRAAARTERLADLVPVNDRDELCRMRLVLLEDAQRGYGGTMAIAAAYRAITGDGHGRRIGVRVIDHQETPGFDDILDPDDWIGSFAGPSNVPVDAVSGATVTAQAVLRAVSALDRREREGRPWC